LVPATYAPLLVQRALALGACSQEAEALAGKQSSPDSAGIRGPDVASATGRCSPCSFRMEASVTNKQRCTSIFHSRRSCQPKARSETSALRCGQCLTLNQEGSGCSRPRRRYAAYFQSTAPSHRAPAMELGNRAREYEMRSFFLSIPPKILRRADQC